MHGFEVLADPVRRRILELLTDGARTAGDIVATIGDEFSISQPAVSQHLKILRDQRFAVVHKDGTRRFYELDPAVLVELEDWLARLHPPTCTSLDALETEIVRGRRERRGRDAVPPAVRTSDDRRKSS
ncbi:metalloregulator ArsR/SmtB family transcription factor [Rhodococcus sp. NPDC047139]|uniref:ArsR/SmtB family transcription factor n=1 Tax=Rhodococcus sp. NPDC047139 TaxID=3155141 RepID=UPI0033E1BCB1